MYPPPRKLKPIWDVAAVLKYIETWGDIKHLSQTRLTQRMVMLLALEKHLRQLIRFKTLLLIEIYYYIILYPSVIKNVILNIALLLLDKT